MPVFITKEHSNFFLLQFSNLDQSRFGGTILPLNYARKLIQQVRFLGEQRCPSFPEHPSQAKNLYYLMISVTCPAPTVLPPSRIAKRRPLSIATGTINFTVIVTLSPGMIISRPVGNSISPVTSVVRK